MAPLAESLGLGNLLPPLEMLLTRGNTAMRWLALQRTDQPVGDIVAAEAAALEARETALEACLATDPATALG